MIFCNIFYECVNTAVATITCSQPYTKIAVLFKYSRCINALLLLLRGNILCIDRF